MVTLFAPTQNVTPKQTEWLPSSGANPDAAAGFKERGIPTSAIDDAEFERLVVLHTGRAWRYAFTFLNETAAADDAVQEAIVRLYERRSDYPLQSKFGPYLIKIVARLCINAQRVRRAEDRHAPIRHRDRQQAKADSSMVDPAVHVQKLEANQELTAAVAELQERDRACLLLTVCEGLSYADAAEALNISVSEVNNSIYRARAALRTRLSGLRESHGDRDGKRTEGAAS